MEGLTKKDLWNDASKGGLALGAVSIAYMFVSQLLTPDVISKIGALPTTLITIVLWVAKFVGCIYLMKWFLVKFSRSYSDITRHDVFKEGAAIAFLSALIYSAFYYAYASFINPQAFTEAIDTAMESYSSFMDSNTTAMMEEMKGKLPMISFISNLIYCSIYGSVLASILSKSVVSDDPFKNNSEPEA